MAGVEIGRVDKIELQTDADGISRARVTMRIRKEEGIIIHSDAKAIIKFTGLMGQNFITIEGGTPKAPRMESGALETGEQPDLAAIMSKLDNVASGVEKLTKDFSTEGISKLFGPLTDFLTQAKDPLLAVIANLKIVSENLAQGKGSIGALLKDETLYNSALGTVTNLQSASSEMKSVMSTAQTLMTNANTAISHMDDVVMQTRGMIADVKAGKGNLGLLMNDDKLYKNANEMMVNLRDITSKINKGEGTVGKLLNNDEFYKNAKLSLQKLDKATEGLEDQGPLSVLGIAVNNLF
jgi:phospholipid/cholesterol/gamma-HCH transport system substrate-binding protein